MDSDRLETDVRLKHPKLGHDADYKNSRSAAIKVFCITCMGGSRSDVKKCESFECPLWQFRPGATKGIKPNGIPTKEHYQKLIDAGVSVARREHGRKLGKPRKKNNNA